jgi:Putative amidoligase enzyme
MPSTTTQCQCGCGNAALFTSNGYSFATRPCRQRFYRQTIRAARDGNAAAVALASALRWNINANIGGGTSTGTRRVSNRVRRAVNRVQRFGVEIEFEGNATAVVDAARSLGLEIQLEGYNHTTRAHWKIVNDSSCGYELVSPPLSGDDGFEQVVKACRALRQAAARVSIRCGLHVHLEANDVDADTIKRLIGNYTDNQNNINAILARSRHASTYASSYALHEVAGIESCRTVQEIAAQIRSRFKTVNLQSFTRYGTVEFRQHQGTHNAEKITNWIRFCIALLDASRTRRVANMATLPALVSALGMSEDSQSFFNERAMELA